MTYELNEIEIFVLLSKQRRRQLMQILRDSDTPLTMTELAQRIGDCEYGSPSGKDVRAIQLSLYHTHLPKLEEANVLEYNENDRTVRPKRNFGILVRFLESVREEDLPWSDG